jgi:AraC-like DNA-binding protein
MRDSVEWFERRPFRDLEVQVVRYRAGSRDDSPSMPLLYASLVLEGSYVERTPYGRHKRLPRSIHFHDSFETNSGRIGPEGALVMSLVVHLPRIAQFAPAFRSHEAIGRPDMARLGSMGMEIAGLMRGGSESELERRLTNLLSVLGDCRRRPITPPEWVALARQTLDRDVASLEDIAAKCGLNPSYLSAAFPRWTGQSIGHYRAEAQFRRARHALLTTDRRIGEIAADLGYCDQSLLNRQFRDRLGMTPREFRVQAGHKIQN